jgi:hypothetical protein
MVEKRDSENDDFDPVDDEAYTETDLFDPESIAQELEAINTAPKRSSGSARATIEELLERKRLRRAIREFDEDDDALDPLY